MSECRELDTPADVRRLAEECTEKYPNDIDAASAALYKAIGRSVEYADFFARKACTQLIYDMRTAHNNRQRTEKGECGSPKVIVGRSAAVRDIYAAAWNRYIEGKTWRRLTGQEIRELRPTLAAKIAGQTRNLQMLDWLEDKIPVGKYVEDCLTEEQFARKWEKLSREICGEQVA